MGCNIFSTHIDTEQFYIHPKILPINKGLCYWKDPYGDIHVRI